MARMSKGLIQEDFAITSSTNFISLLENGKTSPTLQKLEAICSTLDTHPLTLVALAYALESESSTEFDQLLQRVADEVRDLISFQAR
ncbi:helix-turn-helix domain-containing protein [Pseudomonas sp. F01002]|uniref:helix-turn-helix domain-containing protein n=1 Tax=Pseudomonas sp. F01002 TaxID=2555724 RepID=UPI002115998C|nr:helix-turn-helix transcriptional regulator [Pseudomonas sp. F01002]